VPEGADQGGAVLAAAQSAPGLATEFPEVGGTEVGEGVAFEMRPDILDRVEFGSVSGQLGEHDGTGGALDPSSDQAAAVNRQPVPNHQQRAADLAPELPEEVHRLGPADCAGIQAEVEPPPCHPGDHGELFPSEGKMQLGRLPHRSPRAHHARAFAQSALVDEDDGAVFSPGLFFNAGHVRRFHRVIASSSRCKARFSGRWTLQPIAPSTRQRWPG